LQTNPYAKYRQVQIQTASPEQLLLMLYDHAIGSVVRAKKAMEEDRWEDGHSSLIKAQDIIGELTASLNLGAGEMAMNLFAMYSFLSERLVEANVKRDADGLSPVLQILRELRDGWYRAFSGEGPTPAGGGEAASVDQDTPAEACSD